MKKIFTLVLFVLWTSSLVSNNIVISNLVLTGKNTGSHYTMVQFDISWESSWRTSANESNWDAAWVFVKYRVPVSSGGDGFWHHASLNNTGHTAPSGSLIDVGLLTPANAFSASTNPGVGAFVLRNADGSGTFSKTGIKLQWNYGENYKTGTTPIGDIDIAEIAVYAIEMVNVPQGAFYLGSGGSETGSFTNGSWTSGATIPLAITGESALTVAHSAGNLWYENVSTGDQQGPVPAAFPKGYDPFYCMKYEISQQQYVDFLNSLTAAQATARFPGQTIARHGIVQNGSIFSTSLPYVACGGLSMTDVLAYLDWSGLRPMTETEFEKACRGTAQPVSGEYAWGTSTIASSVYSLSSGGGSNESIATGFSASNGNANYLNTSSTIGGPARVGIFAGTTGNTGRITSGATFYGIMEMSGNLYERIVTIGKPAGRAFTGIHGNGALSVSGNADAANWPDNVSADGSGSRGGGYEHLNHLRVSDRNSAAYSYTDRDRGYGGRGVRSVVVPVLTTTAASSITAISASGGGNITSQGGSAVTARGVCWSTSHNPTTTLTTKTSDGSGTGTFTSSITGLTEQTTYYVRAYATNNAGTSYGNEISFTTISSLLSIGDLYQGGKVAYILQSGDPGYSATVQHGLIAALADQSAGAAWGCQNTAISGADGTAIGTGLQNTIDIMNGCATAGIAARLCRGVTINGYSDWYLPSKDELNKL